MERKFYHYKEWEDYQNGLYKLNGVKNENQLIEKCSGLLSNPEKLFKAMKKVVLTWKKSAEVNLTNFSRNRQAWLGQASCCQQFGAPEYLTKIAWRKLTSKQQKEANKVADKVTLEWETIYSSQGQTRLEKV